VSGKCLRLSAAVPAGYPRPVNPVHLFTIRGIPVYASPFYFLLLLMFANGDLTRGLIWAVCITISLLAHELGHAWVARHLRHDPSIMLHGFGGLTSRTRTGRDVEEAAIIAMGPAAGLALGLVFYAFWQGLLATGLALPAQFVYALLYPCIAWNLLNLVPLWPLDGGQLFRLGLARWVSARRATRVTHWLALILLAAVAIPAWRAGSPYTLLLIALLALQNFRGLRGDGGEDPVPASSGLADELVEEAQQALRDGSFKDAARLAQQARAQDGVSPAQLDKIWEILGLATLELGEHEEALSYLRRARPSERVREATLRCLRELDREDELDEIHTRREAAVRTDYMARWLVGALGFIAVAIGTVFATSMHELVF
jgi:stage IV sporulation protein FB